MNKAKWWKISNSISLLFITLIGLMWFNASKDQPDFEQLTNKEEVDKHLSKHFSYLENHNRIPTGLLIQSLIFKSSTEVYVTGYIWQIYEQSEYEDVDNGEEIPVGFILPEAVENASNIEPKFIGRRAIDDDNKEIIIWHFESTLKQQFSYSKYPFDDKLFRIRFWSPDFMQETILVPYFASYKSTELDEKFGYNRNIVLDEWELKNTFFEIRPLLFETRVGKYEEGDLNERPVLNFSIYLKRRFLNSFVVYILPLIIVSCLAFAIVMMNTKDREQAEIYGINTSDVIGVCSGLFFVVLLSQIQIRQQFASSRIVYLEFFYPIVYITLLGVSVDCYLFFRKNPKKNISKKLIDYEDNIIPKLLYWPILLGSSAIITGVVLLPDRQLDIEDRSFLPDNQISGEEMTFLTFNFDLEGLNNPTKTSYQTLLPLGTNEIAKGNLAY